MRTIALIASVILNLACNSSEPKEPLNVVDLTRGVWVKLDSDWHAQEPDSSFTSSAYARVLRFRRGGEFSWIACMLVRDGERVAISSGDGQAYFLGRWRAEGDHATIDYVKVSEMIHVPGSDRPFERKRTATTQIIGDVVTFEGARFTRSFAPDTKSYDDMVAGVRRWHSVRLKAFFRIE